MRIPSRRRRLTALAAAAACLPAAIGLGTSTLNAQAQQANAAGPILSLLCQFADVPATYGITADRINAMWVGDRAIDGLLREVSFNAANIAGSRAFGWFTLPKPKSGYQPNFPSNADLARDCVTSARGGGVDTAGFRYIAVFLNEQLPGAEAVTIPVDYGSGASTTTMVFNHRGLNSPGLLLHELGHVLGAVHTESGSDALGGAAWYGDNPLRPINGIPIRSRNATPGWDAYNRDLMGFVPANRKATFAGGTQQYTLTRLTQPGADGLMLVNVPIGTTTMKYVIAARTRVGYDAAFTMDPAIDFNRQSYGLGAPGVVIERANDPSGRTGAVMSVATDRYGPGAVWVAGQTYTDAANGITIAVNRFDDTGAQITVTGPAGAVPTTAAPTTAAPTTAAPTTVASTTAAPTTAAPTTAPATTAPGAPATTAPLPPVTGGAPTDDFASAPVIAVPARIGPLSTAGATTQVGEQAACGLGSSVWVKFVATTTGPITVTTEGSNFDTGIASYKGTATAALSEIRPNFCDDDGFGSNSLSKFTTTVTAGEVVYIQAGGYAGATGTLVLNIG